jgi:hypothetical protein
MIDPGVESSMSRMKNLGGRQEHGTTSFMKLFSRSKARSLRPDAHQASQDIKRARFEFRFRPSILPACNHDVLRNDFA